MPIFPTTPVASASTVSAFQASFIHRLGKNTRASTFSVRAGVRSSRVGGVVAFQHALLGEIVDLVPLLPEHDLSAVVEHQLTLQRSLLEAALVIEAGERHHQLENVIALGQIEGRPVGIARSQIDETDVVALRPEIPGGGYLVAVDLGESQDPVDGGAPVAVHAASVVEGDAASEVPGHAPETDRPELAVHLAPGPLGADARDQAVDAYLGRVLGGVERPERRSAGAIAGRRALTRESGVEPMRVLSKTSTWATTRT